MKEKTQSISQCYSSSKGELYSPPPSPQRLNSVSTATSASTSSTSLSQTRLNSYCGAIPEEDDVQTEMQSGERADLREGIALDNSSAKTGDDDDRHIAANMSTSFGDNPVPEGKRALRRRSKPIISGSTRPRLVIGRRSSEKLNYPENSEDTIYSERKIRASDQTGNDCYSKKAAFDASFGSRSTRRCENESTLVIEPNPLRSLAMSRRLLASSSFNSLSFVSFKHDDDCSIGHDSNRNIEENDEKNHIRGIEDRQTATVLLKSDLHDKKAVRLHTTSSWLSIPPAVLNPYDRLRRTSSAPVTSDTYDYDIGRHDTHVDSLAQELADEFGMRQPSCNAVERYNSQSEAAKYEGNNDDEEDCGKQEDDVESITFIRSWRTSYSGDRHGSYSDTGKRTDCATERFLPPLKVWVIGDMNELAGKGRSAQDQNAPEAANQRTGKSNQAAPATTRTDVHVVALLPTESLNLENSDDFPKLTTAQVIETDESTYEVIWQENVRNSATGVKEKLSDLENPVNNGQNPLREEHGMDKVIRKLESWFWEDWTRKETSKEKTQDNERSDKLKIDNGVTSQRLSPPSTTPRLAMRAEVCQGDDNAANLAVPPNSARSSPRSSRNPSSGNADDCEVTATTANKLHYNKLSRMGESKQESIAPPITSIFHARPRFSSSPSSPLPLKSEDQVPVADNTNHELRKETKPTATPEEALSNRESVRSTAVRRLSNLTMSELTFRKHRDSILLTRQRLLPAGGGIDASVSSAWLLQDSIILSQKRLLRARKAQSNGASGSTEPMTLASPASAPIDTPRPRPQPAVYRLSTLNGLSPILDVSPPTEQKRSGKMTFKVDGKRSDTFTPTAATGDKHGFQFASLAAFGGSDRLKKAQNIADDKQRSAGLVADSGGGGGDNDDAASANIEMPVLVK